MTVNETASPELKQEIKLLILETLKFDDVTPEEVENNALLFDEEEGLGIDSVDALEIVAALQRKYGVRIDDQNIGRFIIRSVDTISDFVHTQQLGIPYVPPEADQVAEE